MERLKGKLVLDGVTGSFRRVEDEDEHRVKVVTDSDTDDGWRARNVVVAIPDDVRDGQEL